jgi:dTDP-4-amino-4,6-dideoxygalactose transaminase
MIPFNKPYMTGRELENIATAHANGHLAGNGYFSKKCCAWLAWAAEKRSSLIPALLPSRWRPS